MSSKESSCPQLSRCPEVALDLVIVNPSVDSPLSPSQSPEDGSVAARLLRLERSIVVKLLVLVGVVISVKLIDLLSLGIVDLLGAEGEDPVGIRAPK